MMLASPADTSDVIVIVDITRLHDRDSIASVLEEIDALDPVAMDVDVIFERPMDSIGDAHLRRVASTLSNAVFSFRLTDPDREREEFTRQSHSFFAEELKLNEGAVNIDRDVVRDVPLRFEMGGKTYPSVVARMLELLQLDTEGQLSSSIDFKPTVFRIIPYDSVQHYADYIRNRIVMVGGAYESADMLYTPLGQLHGVVVLCYALKSMLDMEQQRDCTGIPFWLLTILFSYLSVSCVMAYKEGVFGMREGLLSDLLRTTLVTSFFIFILMTVYIAVDFWFFYTYRYNFDLTPMLAVTAFAATSADLVRFFVKHFCHART
jgi:CHASE2 domain-containing sensor protein